MVYLSWPVDPVYKKIYKWKKQKYKKKEKKYPRENTLAKTKGQGISRGTYK